VSPPTLRFTRLRIRHQAPCAYSHTYIAYFGNPSTHTGVLSTVHATPNLELYAGVTPGIATALDDNNDSLGFYGGVGLINLFDGRMKSFITTHIGPETPDNNLDPRYINDWTTTIRLTKQWKSLTDICYTHDSAAHAKCRGVSEQLTYQVDERISLGVGAEIFRVPHGFYVAQFGNNQDAMKILRGDAATSPRTVGGVRVA
jgi:hypothetical protein